MPVSERKGTGGIKSEQTSPSPDKQADERLSNSELQQRLQQSGQAAREVAEQKERERQASEFDTLAKEQNKRIANTKANQLYDEVKADLTQEAAEIKQMVKEVNQEIAELEPELIALAKNFTSVQKRIFAHYEKSAKASQQRFYAIAPEYDPNKPAIAQPQPNALGDWLSIVGDDSQFKTISPYSKDRLIEIVLQKVQPVIFLNTAQLKQLSKYKGW